MADDALNLQARTANRLRPTQVQKKRIFHAVVTVFFILYSVLTLIPFYVLFVRTFVPPEEVAELHLWIPRAKEPNLDARLNYLSIFFNLDLNQFKQDMGVPSDYYIQPGMSVKQFAETHDIPLEKMRDYFAPYSLYNGWITLLRGGEFLQALGRSILITLLSLLGLTVLSICTGYGLAGLDRRDKMFVYGIYLASMVIPPMMVLLPQFLLVQWLIALIPGTHTLGIPTRHIAQILSLIVLYIKGDALSTMIFTSYITSIPKELAESAEIDGASRLQYVRHILLPLLKVPVASLWVIMIPGYWNDFLTPYVYLDRVVTTLLPFIQSFTGQYTSNWQVIYTGVFISILPLAVLYLLFRRSFIRGAMAGAIKG